LISGCDEDAPPGFLIAPQQPLWLASLNGLPRPLHGFAYAEGLEGASGIIVLGDHAGAD